MNYMQIRDCDVANGPGVRVSLFVAGCHGHCKGCFNECAKSFTAGKPFTKETEDEIIRLCSRPYVRGLSLLGGDPMAPENIVGLLPLLRRFCAEFGDSKDIWCWTGYEYKDLMDKDGKARFDDPFHYESSDKFLSYIDYLVDGPFIEAKKNLTLAYRGSSNQRILRLYNDFSYQDESEWFDRGQK